jgi:hypothetical protein
LQQNKTTYQKLVILLKQRRKGSAKFLYISHDITIASYHIHELLPVRSKLHGNLSISKEKGEKY